MALADDVLLLQQEMRMVTDVINKMQIAITNLATSEELRKLTLMKQKELESLTTKVDALWAQVQSLAAQINS
jgi:polyhydroxyalkanoate synthesis regulator phasin